MTVWLGFLCGCKNMQVLFFILHCSSSLQFLFPPSVYARCEDFWALICMPSSPKIHAHTCKQHWRVQFKQIITFQEGKVIYFSKYVKQRMVIYEDKSGPQFPLSLNYFQQPLLSPMTPAYDPLPSPTSQWRGHWLIWCSLVKFKWSSSNQAVCSKSVKV